MLSMILNKGNKLKIQFKHTFAVVGTRESLVFYIILGELLALVNAPIRLITYS